MIFFSVVLVIVALFVLVPSLPIHCAEAALDPSATDQQIEQRMAQHGAQPSSVSLLSALYFKLILVLSFLLIGFIALLSILLQVLNSGAWNRWATLTLSISATTLILWGVFLILFSLFGVVGGVAWVERPRPLRSFGCPTLGGGFTHSWAAYSSSALACGARCARVGASHPRAQPARRPANGSSPKARQNSASRPLRCRI